ncbi:MAG TPA: cytochrome o ubiquinol oxidase subunit IV [Steroidobacteraceae bacterium]|nr:cytochrome o ubiquinol oxidase subunit IV [Steroidobacteraceae bacterium]
MSSDPEKFEEFDLGSHVGEDQVAGRPPSQIEHPTLRSELLGYITGLLLAAALTAAAFWALDEHVIYGPGIVMAVIVLGLAQVGVHLVFFLHLTTSPDNTNNALALAFGVLFVSFVFFGSIWVIYHMNHNMMPSAALLQMRGG